MRKASAPVHIEIKEGIVEDHTHSDAALSVLSTIDPSHINTTNMSSIDTHEIFMLMFFAESFHENNYAHMHCCQVIINHSRHKINTSMQAYVTVIFN